jgi:glycosyltransferase involved in cell wall biosynthesis
MNDPIRLLILTHNYPRFSGDYAGVFVALLAKRLIENDIRPIVLAPHDAGAAEEETVEGVKIYRFRYGSDDEETIAYRGNMHNMVLGSISGIFKFKAFLNAFRESAFKIVEKERIQVVSGHWLIPAGIVMKSLDQRYHLPMILSSHGTDVRIMNKYMGVAFRYLKPVCHKLRSWTVVSDYLRDQILAVDPALRDNLLVLPLPHDETVFYRDATLGKQAGRIVAVTRFTDQKRVDYLVKAFAQVLKTVPSARLLMYGSGPLESQVRSLIGSLNLGEAVTIHPPVPQKELCTVYNQAELVVLNSVQEGFGLAISEAMMCGSAVIGANSGGIAGIIRHNETGLLVEPDSVSSLADAMTRLLTDAPLRHRLAANGHTHAVTAYASGPLARRYAQLVRNALYG